MHWLLIQSKIKKGKLEGSGRCATKQLFLKFQNLPKTWLHQSLFTFTTPVVKGLHYNSFWIITFYIQKSYFREYFMSCFTTEAVAQKCSVKKMLLQILKNSHENTCAGVSFLIFFFLSKKKETLAQVLSWEFCKICKNSFSTEHLWWLLLFLHHIEVIAN